jgi:hypothetical protein
VKANIGRENEGLIIPDGTPVCHERTASGVGPARAAVPAQPFARPPRIVGIVTCRGCFNRCTLLPGEEGICGVKRNIGGRITRSTLRVKGIVSRP